MRSLRINRLIFPLVLMIAVSVSSLMITGCGRKEHNDESNYTSAQRLSGEYSNSEECDMGFDFVSDTECLWYWGSRNDPFKCTYYWNSQSNCYHIETEERVDKVSTPNWETEIRQQYSFDFIIDGDMIIIVGDSQQDSLKGKIFKKGKYDDSLHKAQRAAEPIKEHNADVETIPTHTIE